VSDELSNAPRAALTLIFGRRSLSSVAGFDRPRRALMIAAMAALAGRAFA